MRIVHMPRIGVSKKDSVNIDIFAYSDTLQNQSKESLKANSLYDVIVTYCVTISGYAQG